MARKKCMCPIPIVKYLQFTKNIPELDLMYLLIFRLHFSVVAFFQFLGQRMKWY